MHIRQKDQVEIRRIIYTKLNRKKNKYHESSVYILYRSANFVNLVNIACDDSYDNQQSEVTIVEIYDQRMGRRSRRITNRKFAAQIGELERKLHDTM